MKRYTLAHEPTGASYRAILDYAVTMCRAALMVVRPDLPLDSTAVAVLDALKGRLLSEERKSAWPGTQLFGHSAIVRVYEFDQVVADLLKARASRLFEWQQPSLPEDICLLRDLEKPWLVTIAHEADGYFELSDEERGQLTDRIPNLWPLLRDGTDV